MKILVFVALGIILGIFTGTVPGIHSNTLISVLETFGIEEGFFAAIIVSLYPAHLVASFIPSIFFGIPDQATVVSVLPGQRMVRAGKGIAALKTVLASSLFALIASVAVFSLSLEFFPLIYSAIRPVMKYVLLFLAGILIAKTKNPFMSIIIFMLAGMLGLYSLNSDMPDPFLPMFTGMFAMGMILNYQKGKIPEQKDEKISLSFMKYSFLGVLLGITADLIPGVSSPSQVAALASIAVPFQTVSYLATISSVAVSEAVFSLATSATIGKSRIGATVALSEATDIASQLDLLLPMFIISMALTVGIIYLLRKRIAGLAKIDFSVFNVILAFYLASLCLIINGLTGLFVFALGSALGWLTVKSGVERTTLMAAVILPTLFVLFGISI